VTWDNPAHVAPATAEAWGVKTGDEVEITVGKRSVRAPVWVSPGMARDSIAVFLGYGRRNAGRVAEGAGYDAYRLRTSELPWFAGGAKVEKTGKRWPIAATQHHHSMEGRDLARAGDVADFRKNPDLFHHAHDDPEVSLFPDYEYKGYAWGMAIDLSACVGCNACVVACQSENNIPSVGKEQVIAGREMHWIRVDRYYESEAGDPMAADNPRMVHQPVPCMHCERAPCEVVCPVGATVHSDEGLNDMAYNRCVGTRYCSNNCPYKVRRFNFLDYVDRESKSMKLGRNPDVTVRTRGIMEKCTYCVQRINSARIEAKKEDRKIREGEIATACQGACPANAIAFGDINDPDSRVSAARKNRRNYALLGELNTKPRTTYLARLRNPNPELEG
jgi:molybdopterin-containing oxidoreductase family iron-sulfur binding subunit